MRWIVLEPVPPRYQGMTTDVQKATGRIGLRGENTKSSYVYFEYFSVEKVLLNIQMEMAYKQLNLRVYSLEKLELEMEVWEDTV